MLVFVFFLFLLGFGCNNMVCFDLFVLLFKFSRHIFNDHIKINFIYLI